jgi:hypothetical protein
MCFHLCDGAGGLQFLKPLYIFPFLSKFLDGVMRCGAKRRIMSFCGIIIIIIIIIISCHKFSFFPGTSPLEPEVNPTTQASSLSL